MIITGQGKKNKTIQINPDLAYLEMVEGGRYNVEN
jgi:hypothetical protein